MPHPVVNDLPPEGANQFNFGQLARSVPVSHPPNAQPERSMGHDDHPQARQSRFSPLARGRECGRITLTGRRTGRCKKRPTIDLLATLLEFFDLALPTDMQGLPLRKAIATDAPVREAALYGLHGGHVNVTDGRYTYMRAPARPRNTPLYNYTLMPTHMRARFSVWDAAL